MLFFRVLSFISIKSKFHHFRCKTIIRDLILYKNLYIYEGDSIYNEIALITPPTHGLELYTIYGMKDQGFTFRMMHTTLFYHSYFSSYRL